MFLDTTFWRLMWKEYRTHRPLWLAMLIATPVLQNVFLAMTWAIDGYPPLVLTDGLKLALLGIGYAASMVYVLGCGATLFSVEHETGVFDFQRVLPANQPRVFWSKVGFAFGSSVALTLLLWGFTRGVFVLTSPLEGTVYGGFGLLFLVEVFLWGILCSLIIRLPLWGVITAMAAQSLMLYFVVPYLGGPMRDSDWPGSSAGYVPTRIGIVLALCVADIVLGKLWFEDRLRLPRWRLRLKPEIASSYPSEAELPPYVGRRQIGWSRLLWLGWCDGRWVIGGVLAWYGYCWWTTRNANDWEFLMLPALTGSIVLGLFAFAPDQWAGRFRFFTERGCSPRFVWLSRQAIYLPPVLLLSLLSSVVHSHAQFAGRRGPDDIAAGVMLAALGPLLAYCAGQFAAMLVRRTVVAMAVGLGLAIGGLAWGLLMTAWLAPTWWSVGSLPVIGLFVTWLKADDWIEERCDRVARWRLALGLGIPVFLLLATCATYRVVQIPGVALPAEWCSADELLAKFTPAESATLEHYGQALTEMETGGKDWDSSFQKALAEVSHAHRDWVKDRQEMEAGKIHRQRWLAKQQHVVRLLKQAHVRVPVPLALVDSGPPNFETWNWKPNKSDGFSWLMIEQAQQTVAEERLDEAWEEFEVAWELLRRTHLRTSTGYLAFAEMHEHFLLEVIAQWGRHPKQTREHIQKAIRRLEERAAQDDAVRCQIHRNLLSSSVVLNSEEWRKYLASTFPGSPSRNESMFWWDIGQVLPWERWRSERVLRWQAALALARADELKLRLESNQPVRHSHLTDIDFDPESVEMTLVDTTMLRRSMDYLIAAQFLGLSRAEAFRTTILRLALADWRREHGRYPNSLSELAPTYFADVPRDPRTAEPFVYFPRGVPDDVTDGTADQGTFRVVVPKDAPFLWTASASNISARRGADGGWEFFVGDRELMFDEAVKQSAVWPLEAWTN